MNFLFKVHTYLFYTIVACMFTSVFEMIYINDVRPALARAAFTLLQGTWFYQVCNHPWPLRVFGFRFISAYNSYIIILSFGRNMLIWSYFFEMFGRNVFKPLRSKDVWGWILRFWPRKFLTDPEKTAPNLKMRSALHFQLKKFKVKISKFNLDCSLTSMASETITKYFGNT